MTTATSVPRLVVDDVTATARANGWRVMPGRTDDGDTILTAPAGGAVLRVDHACGWARLTDAGRVPAQQTTRDPLVVASWLTGATS